jgi:hypothetical protein
MDSSQDLSLADAEKVTRKISNYISATLQEISPTEIDSVSATRIYRAYRDKRLFNNEFVIHLQDDEVSLIAESPRSRVEASPESFIWFWNNHLWPMYTLTMWWRSADAEKKVSFRAFFKLGSRDLDCFRTKPTKIIILRGQKCISACVLNLQNVDPAMWDIFAKQIPSEAVCDDTI